MIVGFGDKPGELYNLLVRLLQAYSLINHEPIKFRLMNTSILHKFHIPVMGIGFTIDTPIKVARFGISSVISIVEDELIEQMRKFHCQQTGEEYSPIKTAEEDARAKRITAYLNLVHRIVQRQTEQLRQLPFEPGSEIVKYFELLPDGVPAKSGLWR